MRDIWAKCADQPYIFQGLADVYCRYLFEALATVAQLEDLRRRAFGEGYLAGVEDAWRESTDYYRDDIV